MSAVIAMGDARRAWAATAGIALLAAVCLGALFSEEVVGVYRVWLDSTAYNHCFLILPLVGYMIWDRQAVLASSAPTPRFWTLALVPALSVLWLAAASLGIHEAQQLIALTALQAILLSLMGWAAYRRLMAPLLYLYFLVPTGEFLVPYLQDITAGMTVRGLHLVGVPVISDGVFIEVPAGKFVVAEECAGLRFLIASVAFGVFFAVITYESWTRRALFIALSVMVPIAANVLRAFGIIYAAELVGSAQAIMADHVVYGWGFFSAILLLLILLGRSFADRRSVADARPRAQAWGFEPVRSALVALAGVALAGLGPAYAMVLERQTAPEVVVHAEAPPVRAPWTPMAGGGADDWKPVVYGADRTLLDALISGDATVRRFVALYVAHGRVNNLIRSDNRVADERSWRIATARGATLSVSGRDQPVTVSEIVSGGRRRLVVSFYVVDGAVTSGVLATKLHQLRGLLTAGPQVSAFVAIAIDMPDRDRPPLATAAQFLGAMEPLDGYLRGLSSR